LTQKSDPSLRSNVLRRLVLGAVAVSLAATGSSAFAVARPAPCHLLTDPEGDGKWSLGGDVVQSPAVDILSADVATGARSIVAVLRVTTTDTAADPFATLGMSWSVTTEVRGRALVFRATRSYGPSNALRPSVVGASSSSGLTLRTEPGSFVWTLPRSATELKPRGTILLQAASTSVGAFSADGAQANKTYVDRAPSCVKAP
jgi:hypothetical protein